MCRYMVIEAGNEDTMVDTIDEIENGYPKVYNNIGIAMCDAKLNCINPLLLNLETGLIIPIK